VVVDTVAEVVVGVEVIDGKVRCIHLIH
jgi:hypothetical protein